MNNVFATLASAVGSVAPTLATMLGGPLAGTAVSALESCFGVSGADNITKVLQTGAMTPDVVAKVRAADQAHAEKMKALDLDLNKLNAAHSEAFAADDVADRASARQREETVKDYTPRVLAGLIVVLTAGCEGMLLFHGHVDGVDDIVLGRILGTLDSALMLVLSYYFGSSAGSVQKNILLANSAPAK